MEQKLARHYFSQITDEVLEEVKVWQNRPLESLYLIVYFDCIVVKVRQGKRIINKAVYVTLGIDLNGKKDVLGLWISENEGAKFWLSNFYRNEKSWLKWYFNCLQWQFKRV